MSIVLRSLFYNVFVSNVLKSYIAFSNHVTCVVPENIDNPPPNRRDWKFQVVGGCLNEFFFPDWSQFSYICMYGNIPTDDVSVKLSNNFFGIKIWYLALKIYSLFLVSTRNDNISRGCVTKMEFPEGRGSPFCESILENPEGRGAHR